MTTSEVVKAATTILCNTYEKVLVHKDDFVYAVGTAPITIVAHMDTVRDPQLREGEKPRYDYHINKPYNLQQYNNVLWNADGVLGADDRAGVFGCIELMRMCKKHKLQMPSIILTNGEESGGKGVGVFVATEAFKKWDKGNTRLFVEMDRQGCNDWVTYGSDLPKEVVSYVESFGFRKSHGSYSDICDLQEEYLIPSVNVSIGYYQQHSANEHLHIDEMYMTIHRIMAMFKDPIEQLYPVKPKVRYGSWNNGAWEANRQPGKKHTQTTTSQTTTIGTTAKGTGSATEWIDPTGDTFIDDVLDKTTQGGFCLTCGHHWTDCEEDSCGEMMALLQAWLSEKQMEAMVKTYLSKYKTSAITKSIKTYLKNVAEIVAVDVVEDTTEKPATGAEKEKEDVTSPFHVGKEGDPVAVIPETTKETEEAKHGK
jgi:hypothetical protein